MLIQKIRTRINRLIHSLVLKNLGFGNPVSKDIWDNQYASGIWNYLDGEAEASHYFAILENINAFHPRGAILDIGCGHGVFYSYLLKNPFFQEGSYKGIDISEEAIAIASRSYNTPNFIVGDYDKLLVESTYDLVVFNESLYYFNRPIVTLEKAMKNLKSGGVVIVSMCEYPGNEAIWKAIHAKFVILSEKKVCNNLNQKWTIKAIQVAAE